MITPTDKKLFRSSDIGKFFALNGKFEKHNTCWLPIIMTKDGTKIPTHIPIQGNPESRGCMVEYHFPVLNIYGSPEAPVNRLGLLIQNGQNITYTKLFNNIYHKEFYCVPQVRVPEETDRYICPLISSVQYKTKGSLKSPIPVHMLHPQDLKISSSLLDEIPDEQWNEALELCPDRIANRSWELIRNKLLTGELFSPVNFSEELLSRDTGAIPPVEVGNAIVEHRRARFLRS